MTVAAPKPITRHLENWTRPELADAAEAVKAMRESEGWKALQRGIEDRLHKEQADLMRSGPHGDAAKYERTVGQWAGLREVDAIAEGIVRLGEQAAREMAA